MASDQDEDFKDAVEVDDEPVKVIDLPSGITQIIMTIAPEKKYTVPTLFANCKTLMLMEPVDSFRDYLHETLITAEGKADNDKIKHLKYCINTFPLARAHELRLSFIRDAVITQFTYYITNPSFSRLYTSPTHTLKATETIEFMRHNAKPKELLNKLFELRKFLKEQKSIKLMERVDHILLNAYACLSSMHSDQLHSRKMVTKH